MKSFEDKIKRLEELNQLIKERDIPLEKAVQSFDEGIKLANELEKELRKVEKKIEILLNEPAERGDEKPELGLFDQSF